MDTQQYVQELKSERVQAELVPAEEGYGIALKSERVQEEIAAVDGGVAASSSVELVFTSFQPMTIELPKLGAVINIHGAAAGNGVAGSQTAGRVAG